MSISYPRTPPSSRGAATSVWRFRKEAGIAASEFTKQQQVTEWPGDGWEVDISLPPMYRAMAAEWIAWLTSLDGILGTFYWGPDGAERGPRGTATGSPTVNGGSQTGKTLTLQSWTGTLLPGDFVQVLHGGSGFKRLYMNLATVSGPSTLDIRPTLRTPSPDSGDACSFIDPVGMFRLAQEQEWSIDKAQVYGISFKAVEAI